MSHLLAKSTPAGIAPAHSATILGHLQEVTAAARVVTDVSGTHQLQALGLDESWKQALSRSVILSAALHDIGKMNASFQQMLRGSDRRQPVFHEFVSWYLVTETLRDWLSPAMTSEIERLAVSCAVVGHHRRTESLGSGSPSVEVLLGHPEAREVLTWIAESFQLSHPPPTTNAICEPAEPFEAWCRSTRRRFQALSQDERRFVAAVKASIIGADVAGSALRATSDSVQSVITRWLENVPGQSGLLSILEQRLGPGGGRKLRRFQVAVRDSKSRVTLVRAGCGSGKTLAAYAWAAARHPQRRLFFCYPTTGTATEGYRGYLLPDYCPPDSILLHSRAEVDVELMLGVGKDQDDSDDELRVSALRAWSAPIVACTVDTVLGLMENTRAGLYAWPSLANSSFVFDEIHSYDDRLFNALVAFLHDLPGLPALLMTASLQEARLLQLRALGVAEIEGDRELEERPRYQRTSSSDPFELAKSFVARDKKVLWVCNTVKSARETAQKLGRETKLYHSRYRYIDRLERHRDIMSAFENWEGRGVAAVCTQVAEMSLDLSADLLVTELAPVSALIQRLGRLNRFAPPGGDPGRFLVLEPDGVLPYSKDEIESARIWLVRLGTAPLSQQDLISTWAGLPSPAARVDLKLGWQHGGAHTVPGQIRDGGATISVILSCDEAKVRSRKVLLASVLLPILPPKNQNWRDWHRVRGFPIAPAGSVDYDPLRGAN